VRNEPHRSRNQQDFNRHADYIHWNPVKHRWVRFVANWPHSSFHEYGRRWIYPADWGGGMDEIVVGE